MCEDLGKRKLLDAGCARDIRGQQEPQPFAHVHLYRARLFFRENRDEAREELKKARALIERYGYHRRDEELIDAEAVIEPHDVP